MCCGDAKTQGPAPFEVDNPRYEGGELKADIYNAAAGYNLFGFTFNVTWSDGSQTESKGAMWLTTWVSPKYTYHASLGKRDKDGVVLGVKTLTVEAVFAMAADGTVWGDENELKDHLLRQERSVRRGVSA